MSSINSLLSPEGYDWGVPSISDGVDHAGPSNNSVESNVDGFHTYESFHAVSTETPQVPSDYQNIEPQFKPPEDVPMEDQAANTQQENLSALSDSQHPKAKRKSRQGNLDLDIHKEELRQLYLIQDKSLKVVMADMKENHSLPES